MANITETTISELPSCAESKAGLARRSLFLVQELLAISFWIYAICKLFIFDIDVFAIRHLNEQYIWLSEYRFLIFIGVISAFLLLTKNKYLIALSLYVLFYPAIVLCWKVPRLAFKKGGWLLLFALINTAISAFTSFKYKFVAFTIFALSTFATFTLLNPTLLALSMICLVGILLSAYVRMSFLVFRPSGIFQAYSKLIKKCPDLLLNTLSDKDIRRLPVETLSESQLDVRRTSLQTIVIGNRALLFLARRLKDFQDSKLNSAAYVFNLFLLFAFHRNFVCRIKLRAIPTRRGTIYPCPLA
jgi:hypothetical protein